MRKLDGLIALTVLLAFGAKADDAAQGSAPSGGDGSGRFYAGLDAATLEHVGHHDGAPFAAGSFGKEAFGGFKLSDNLSLEVSLQSDEAVDRNDIAGRRTTRADINSGWDTVSVKAVGDLSLQELLSWRHNWRLFGAVGYYRSDLDRTVQWYGVPDDREGWDAGVAIQLRF